MTVEVNSRITIGKFKPFRGVNDIVIKKSVGSFLNTAVIRLPLTARLKQAGKSKTQSVLTATQFNRGDKVKIELGYNGQLVDEFEGFVSRLDLTTPLLVECEGYAFLLRNKTINQSWKQVTLKEVLNFIIVGTEIVLGEVDDIIMDKLVLYNETGFTSLSKLKQFLGNSVNIWFEGNVLNGGYKYTFFTKRQSAGKPDVKYKIGYTTAAASELKRHEDNDNEVIVEVYNKAEDGKSNASQSGTKGDVQRIQVQNVSDEGVQKQIAVEKQTELNHRGWEGKIQAFLIPYCKPGYKMSIEDTRYTERSGNYLVEGVETHFGLSGARRTVEISIEL